MPVHPIEYHYHYPEMYNLFTEEAKLQKWLDVEVALARAHAQVGTIPKEAAEEITRKGNVDDVKLDRVKEIEGEIHHDIMAMVRAFTEVCEGESGKYIHLGATSSDIADTALALQLKVALDIIEADIKTLILVIREQRELAQEIEKQGHPQKIQPFSIIFKTKFALWAAEITRHWDRLRETRKRVLVGKMSGAIGTMASFGESGFEIQRITMERLGLDPVLITNQIIQRDRHAELQCVLAIMASTLEKISCEMGNLIQLETVKPISTVQDGANAMLQKYNVSATDVGNLARIIRSSVYVSLESIALEHERDLSNSSVERIYIPESFIFLDYIFRQITKLVKNFIDSDR